MQSTVFGHDITHAIFVEDTADHLTIGMLGDFDDTAFRAAATIFAGDAHQHTIAMQGFFHLAVIQKDVGALVTADRGFRTGKTEAIRVTFNATGNQIGLGRQNQRALAVTHELAFALHGADAAFERLQFLIRDGELLRELIFVDRPACTMQDTDHIFARRQRVFVFLPLAFVMRVLAPYFGEPGTVPLGSL